MAVIIDKTINQAIEPWSGLPDVSASTVEATFNGSVSIAFFVLANIDYTQIGLTSTYVRVSSLCTEEYL